MLNRTRLEEFGYKFFRQEPGDDYVVVDGQEVSLPVVDVVSEVVLVKKEEGWFYEGNSWPWADRRREFDKFVSVQQQVPA